MSTLFLDIHRPACKKDVSICVCADCQRRASPRRCSALLKKGSECIREVERGNKISLSSLRTWWEKHEWFACTEKSSNETVEILNTVLSKNHPPRQGYIEEIIMQDDENSKVTLISRNEELAVKKTILTTSTEALIHKQLHDTLRDTPLLDFIPSFRGLLRKRDVYELYMDHIEGPTLKEAMPSMSLAEFDRVMALLHGFLALLTNIGFVHGDWHLRNVVLKGYGSHKTYEVPLIVGEEFFFETLPFFPVILDFGHSVTHTYSLASPYHSPYLNTMTDVLRFYSCLGSSGEGTTPVEKVLKRINSLFERETEALIVPTPLSCRDLAHESLQKLYVTLEE